MKEFQLEGEDSSAELLETTVANEMAETGWCYSGINSFAVVDPRLQGLHCFSFLLALRRGAIWRQSWSWRDVSSSCSTVSSTVQPWAKRTAWHETIMSCWLLAADPCLGDRLGLAIDDGSPLHFPHRFQLDPHRTSTHFWPPLKKQGFLRRMCQKGKILAGCLLCNFHAAWRGRHPVRGDCFVCLVFLTLGKLSPIPGEEGDQCRLPYQLGQAAGGTTPQPSSSPCHQCLGASTREAPSPFLSFPLRFSSSLD